MTAYRTEKVKWFDFATLNSVNQRVFTGNRLESIFRRGPGGGLGGGRLKVGVEVLDTEAVTKGFAVSASPQPLSLVRFLCGHKK